VIVANGPYAKRRTRTRPSSESPGSGQSAPVDLGFAVLENGRAGRTVGRRKREGRTSNASVIPPAMTSNSTRASTYRQEGPSRSRLIPPGSRSSKDVVSFAAQKNASRESRCCRGGLDDRGEEWTGYSLPLEASIIETPITDLDDPDGGLNASSIA